MSFCCTFLPAARSHCCASVDERSSEIVLPRFAYLCGRIRAQRTHARPGPSARIFIIYLHILQQTNPTRSIVGGSPRLYATPYLLCSMTWRDGWQETTANSRRSKKLSAKMSECSSVCGSFFALAVINSISNPL